jgi:hypothetical protein
LSLGIDHILAQHIAHLFIRDTLTLFEEKLNLDDTKDADHFEVKILFHFFIRTFLCLEYQFNKLAINEI